MERFGMEVTRGMSIQPGELERTRFEMGPPVDHDPGSRPGFGAALRRHWRVMFACIGGMVLLAIAYSAVRTPNYAAETRLAVGGLNASTPASLTGFSAAAQQLAETYSRSAQGDAVVRDVAKVLKTTPEEIRPHLSAAPIPQTPVFLLTATTKSEATSIDMSRLASQALVREANRASDATPGRLLARYEAAESHRQQVAKQVEALAQGAGSGNLAEARADLIGAKAQADSLRKAYISSQEGGSVPLEIIAAAGRRDQRPLQQAPAAPIRGDRRRIHHQLGYHGVPRELARPTRGGELAGALGAGAPDRRNWRTSRAGRGESET